MGTKFMSPAFKAPGQNLNMNARALSAPIYGARQSGIASLKDLALANSLGHPGFKKLTGGSAYPAGPKV